MIKKIQLLTNLDCNLRCKYCYENKSSVVNNIKDIKLIVLNYYKTIIKDEENLQEQNEKNVIIDFIGGESLLHPEFLEKCFDAIIKTHYDSFKLKNIPLIFSICTNGTLLNPENTTPTAVKTRELIQKYKKYIYLGFSIDGTKEIHDANRIYIDGKGSYDDVIKGYEWAKTVLCNKHRLSCKGTYNHTTIKNYAEGVINLIQLGFKSFACNCIFEEKWSEEEDSFIIYDQLVKVADYILEHDLEFSLEYMQLGLRPEIQLPMINLLDEINDFQLEKNWCGSCEFMRCLGMDRKVYGCNRFNTMKEPMEIGELQDDGSVKITNQKLIDEVCNQYKIYNEVCDGCRYRRECSSCAAIAYEIDKNDPGAFIKLKRMCGYTKAIVAGKLYLRNKIIEKYTKDGVFELPKNKH